MKNQASRLLFGRLSIQQRLSLVISILLLMAIAIYGFANYYNLKKATLLIARERLATVTSQFTQTFSQSEAFLVKTSNTAASETSVIQYLVSGGIHFRKEALEVLDKLYRDSTWVSEELLDSNLVPVLRSGKSTLTLNLDIKNILPALGITPAAGKVGKIYNVGDAVYLPVISAVAYQKHTVGYVVSWLTLHSSPKIIAQFSQLVGIGANFYVGNRDGSLWTDLLTPLPGVPFQVTDTGRLVEFTGNDGRAMIANAQFIPNTEWVILIAFSKQALLAGVNSFVNWIIFIGIILLAIGILAAWLASRSITKPLYRLNAAAEAVSQGLRPSAASADVDRNDELGRLAVTFNSMAAEVYRVREELEQQVSQRTSQLEYTNKELEAFSYSVSHDLRAPLRAISGYAAMLKEDYEVKPAEEGNRVISRIVANAGMMGQLIDDLLAFSKLGKKDLIRTTVDMQDLAANVADELQQQWPPGRYSLTVGTLPPVLADRMMMKQVWINLVGNALKYSSKKKDPVIEIGSSEEEGKMIYYVKDNGEGFDMAYAGKLFGVFQRLHSQQDFEGSGVGLALVKRIMEKHSGEVWAESTRGKGAVFYFSLPV